MLPLWQRLMVLVTLAVGFASAGAAAGAVATLIAGMSVSAGAVGGAGYGCVLTAVTYRGVRDQVRLQQELTRFLGAGGE